MGEWGACLPAMMTTRASSSRAAALGDADMSCSLTALRSQDTMSWGIFSASQVYLLLVSVKELRSGSNNSPYASPESGQRKKRRTRSTQRRHREWTQAHSAATAQCSLYPA
jgi:hypothetical protein